MAVARGRVGSIDSFDTVDGFVQDRGGTKVIKKVLLANNGIAAVKIMRSIRQWAYQTFNNEKAVQFVSMYTPDDLAVRGQPASGVLWPRSTRLNLCTRAA